MPLSRGMHDALNERFPEPKHRPAAVAVGYQLLRWFCPGCGVLL